MATAAAVILMREREIVEAFSRAGATSPATAKPIDVVGIDAQGIGMRRLRDHAVIREAAPGSWYVDLEVWQALRRIRHRIALILLVLMLAAAVAYAFRIGS